MNAQDATRLIVAELATGDLDPIIGENVPLRTVLAIVSKVVEVLDDADAFDGLLMAAGRRTGQGDRPADHPDPMGELDDLRHLLAYADHMATTYGVIPDAAHEALTRLGDRFGPLPASYRPVIDEAPVEPVQTGEVIAAGNALADALVVPDGTRLDDYASPAIRRELVTRWRNAEQAVAHGWLDVAVRPLTPTGELADYLSIQLAPPGDRFPGEPLTGLTLAEHALTYCAETWGLVGTARHLAHGITGPDVLPWLMAVIGDLGYSDAVYRELDEQRTPPTEPATFTELVEGQVGEVIGQAVELVSYPTVVRLAMRYAADHYPVTYDVRGDTLDALIAERLAPPGTSTRSVTSARSEWPMLTPDVNDTRSAWEAGQDVATAAGELAAWARRYLDGAGASEVVGHQVIDDVTTAVATWDKVVERPIAIAGIPTVARPGIDVIAVDRGYLTTLLDLARSMAASKATNLDPAAWHTNDREAITATELAIELGASIDHPAGVIDRARAHYAARNADDGVATHRAITAEVGPINAESLTTFVHRLRYDLVQTVAQAAAYVMGKAKADTVDCCGLIAALVDEIGVVPVIEHAINASKSEGGSGEGVSIAIVAALDRTSTAGAVADELYGRRDTGDDPSPAGDHADTITRAREVATRARQALNNATLHVADEHRLLLTIESEARLRTALDEWEALTVAEGDTRGDAVIVTDGFLDVTDGFLDDVALTVRRLESRMDASERAEAPELVRLRTLIGNVDERCNRYADAWDRTRAVLAAARYANLADDPVGATLNMAAQWIEGRMLAEAGSLGAGYDIGVSTGSRLVETLRAMAAAGTTQHATPPVGTTDGTAAGQPVARRLRLHAPGHELVAIEGRAAEVDSTIRVIDLDLPAGEDVVGRVDEWRTGPEAGTSVTMVVDPGGRTADVPQVDDEVRQLGDELRRISSTLIVPGDYAGVVRRHLFALGAELADRKPVHLDATIRAEVEVMVGNFPTVDRIGYVIAATNLADWPTDVAGMPS